MHQNAIFYKSMNLQAIFEKSQNGYINIALNNTAFYFIIKLSKINWYFTWMYTELSEQIKYLKHHELKMFNKIQVSIDVCMYVM